jgi:hypothetical protein
MKPYLWMMDFTPQREWIDRQGLLLWLAFFFSEIGAGIYLVSLFLGYWLGGAIGWITCAVLGGGFHLTGKGVACHTSAPHIGTLKGLHHREPFPDFGDFAARPFPKLFPGPALGERFSFLQDCYEHPGILCDYPRVSLSVVSALPFWNSAIVPVLSLASGIWLGTQMVTGLSLGANQTEILAALEPVARWSLFSYVFLTIFYLWNAKHGSLAAQQSLKLLTSGQLALPFYFGVVLIALMVPTFLTILIYAKSVEPTHGVLYLRVGCAFVGDLTLRYCILKAARYFPLIESNVIAGIRQHTS